MVYLAGPYTHRLRRIRHERYRRLTKASAILIEKNVINFSPITQSHEQCRAYKLPHKWKFWKHVDTEFVRRCDELWILEEPGWDKSVGVAGEIKIAKKLGKPIYMIKLDEETDKLYLGLFGGKERHYKELR